MEHSGIQEIRAPIIPESATLLPGYSLEQISEPASPPRIAQARGPPEWEGGEPVFDGDHEGFDGDPLAQPEPEVEFDQRVAW